MHAGIIRRCWESLSGESSGPAALLLLHECKARYAAAALSQQCGIALTSIHSRQLVLSLCQQLLWLSLAAAHLKTDLKPMPFWPM